MDLLLQIIFLNRQHDLKFVSKFRMISKWCKNYSAKWLTEILNTKFLYYVDVKEFKNLRKLKCHENITDDDLLSLKYLTHLYLNGNSLITDNGLKYLYLDTLILNCYHCIENDFQVIQLSRSNITDDGIMHMQLKTLDICWKHKITEVGIRNSYQSLHTLYAYGNENITNSILQHLNLEILDIGDNDKVTNAGIKHMKLKKLGIKYSGGITDEGIKNMDLIVLRVIGNENITRKGISHMTNCLC